MEETAALFMLTDDLIYSPLHHLSLMVVINAPPFLCPHGPIYISYRGHNQLWEVGCRLFIDVQRHSNHTILMSQSAAVINRAVLCIKPD